MPDPVVDNNGTAAAKSRNPFVDASQPRQKQELELLHVAQKGTQLVTGITKYFSTLPHPIEIVEELVAVVAVTSSLLTALDHALSRFPHLALSRSKSFIAPLCHDVLFAFMLLGSKVDEAKRMKIFEPNDVGLVRLPKSAWVLVVGSEPKVAALRSRLYIEKYRVRVLIETVCFVGLKKLSFRRQKEEEELRALKAMMPLIAERLVGVQTDYVPRLTGRKALPEPAVQVQATIPVPVVEKKSELPVMEIKEKPTLIEEQHFSCRVVASGKESVFSASTDSLTSTCSSSSSTLYDSHDTISELWLLRHNAPRSTPKSRISILGIPFYTKNTLTPSSYYVKPISSCLAEIKDMRRRCLGSLSQSQHEMQFKKRILKMDDEAQWEIQRLLESREKASSGESVRRDWGVVGFMERSRRYICAESMPREKKWYKFSSLKGGKKEECTEWVVIIQGQTIDHRSRALPYKHEDPWNPRPQRPRALAPAPAPVPVVQQQQVPPAQQQPHIGTVLRYVENRHAMSIGEAERKMEEIVGELFICDGVGDV